VTLLPSAARTNARGHEKICLAFATARPSKGTSHTRRPRSGSREGVSGTEADGTEEAGEMRAS
jgi:hypothetical protein